MTFTLSFSLYTFTCNYVVLYKIYMALGKCFAIGRTLEYSRPTATGISVKILCVIDWSNETIYFYDTLVFESEYSYCLRHNSNLKKLDSVKTIWFTSINQIGLHLFSKSFKDKNFLCYLEFIRDHFNQG